MTNRHKPRKMTVKLIETGKVLNTRIVAEIVANKIRRGDDIL